MFKGPFPSNQFTGSYSYYTWNMVRPQVYSNQPLKLVSGSISSVKTPGFRSIPKHQLPFNPYFHRVLTNTIGTHEEMWVYTDGSLVELKSGNINYGYTSSKLPVIDTAEAQRKARAKVLNQIKDSSFNAAQAYAERSQTANLMAKSVNRLASAAMAVRRGNFKHACTLFGMDYTPRIEKFSRRRRNDPLNDPFRRTGTDMLSSYWLEFQYGWKPLLQDIYGAAELIAKTYHQKKPTIARSSATVEMKVQSIHDVWQDAGGAASNRICQSSGTVTARYTIEYGEDNAFLNRMAQTGITNPALLAWELLPYSFVIDWFVPVGDYLSQIDATAGLVFKRGTVATHSRVTHSLRWQSTKGGASGQAKSRSTSKPDLVEEEIKNRSVLTLFPSPAPPRFEPSLGVARCLSGISLLAQAFGRIGRR